MKPTDLLFTLGNKQFLMISCVKGKGTVTVKIQLCFTYSCTAVLIYSIKKKKKLFQCNLIKCKQRASKPTLLTIS